VYLLSHSCLNTILAWAANRSLARSCPCKRLLGQAPQVGGSPGLAFVQGLQCAADSSRLAPYREMPQPRLNGSSERYSNPSKYIIIIIAAAFPATPTYCWSPISTHAPLSNRLRSNYRIHLTYHADSPLHYTANPDAPQRGPQALAPGCPDSLPTPPSANSCMPLPQAKTAKRAANRRGKDRPAVEQHEAG